MSQSDPLNCPRCESTNTKFCYYNNYNKTQPRYFCKACKRHWTKGGTLRTVPVGGGRKIKRLKRPLRATTATTAARIISNPPKDQKKSFLPPDADDHKASFFKPILEGERRDGEELYTDIEELKGLVSWDFYGSTFIGCTMMQQLLDHEDDHHPRLGFSKLSDANPSSNISRFFFEKIEKDEDSTVTTTSNFLELNNWSWNDLDTMVLEDLNEPWEDPEFKT